MIIWGIYFVYIKEVITKVGWFLPTYVLFFLAPFIFIWARLRGKSIHVPHGKSIWIPLILSTVLVRTAEFAYNAGIEKGLVSVVAPISGANPTLFVLLAFLFLKDPLKKQQIFGIALALTGIVALGLTQ